MEGMGGNEAGGGGGGGGPGGATLPSGVVAPHLALMGEGRGEVISITVLSRIKKLNSYPNNTKHFLIALLQVHC